MLTGTGRLVRQECSLEHTLNPFTLERELLLDDFFAISFVVDIKRCKDASFLASMVLILIPACSLMKSV